MPDPFKKVRPGEDVTFSAAVWNAMIDAARAARDGGGGTGGARTTPRDGDIVRVRNDSGADLARRSVLGLDGPIFTPADSEDAFLREVTFKGVTPTGDHQGKFCILLEPAPQNRVVRAYVGGVAQVKLHVADPAHTCADVSAGDTSALLTSDDGSAQVLWKDSGAYGAAVWSLVRFGAGCGSAGKTSRPGDCGCKDGPYEIQVDCGDCGAYGGYYDDGTTMPKYWWATITSGATHYGYYDSCAVGCEQLAGYRVRLTNEADGYGAASCAWTGSGGLCVHAELTVSGGHWQLAVTDKDGCVLAVLRKPVDEFDCCGTNAGWTLDPASVCDLSVSLAPDPCTCCPERTCPPDGKPVCAGTDCCLEDCNCHLTVTVTNLVTVPGTACTAFDTDCTCADGSPCSFGGTCADGSSCIKNRPTPETSCGGMAGSYPVAWDSNCTWKYRGYPSRGGAGFGTTKTAAKLSLSGRKWTLELLGEDGQTATFVKDGWDCSQHVVMDYQGGSCPIAGNPPVAEFNLCLDVN